jgi:hypothetical protein
MIPKSMVMMLMPESKGNNGGERYLVIVEK